MVRFPSIWLRLKLKTCQSECHGKLAKIIANQMVDMTGHKETFEPASQVRD